MPETDPNTTRATTASASAPPSLVTALTPAAITSTLQTLSQRGKLPGFERQGDSAFRLRAYGEPFDYWLNAAMHTHLEGTRIDFDLKIIPKLPLIALVLTILSVQPGMWLTDSMLITYSEWYAAHVQTWWWYLPLVVLPTPWFLWRMWRKSATSAQIHAMELHGRVASALSATPRP